MILIVDDEPIGRSALQALLAREGYRLETAADGPSALRKAEELLPDLILLDVMMPGMDGFDVTRQLRVLPALAEVPILLVTALDDQASRLSGIEAGADDFITKPFDRIELRARIRTITRLNRFRHLTEQRERYLRLFERSPCGLIVIDGETRVREANSAARGLLEKWTGSSEKGSLLSSLSADSAGRLREMLATAGNDPTATPRAEFLSKAKTGLPLWVELAVSRFSTLEDDLFQVALIDRTAERLLEEELRQVQKMDSIGQLAGGIAHDFNNLLTVINGFSMLALDHLTPADPSCDMIHEVYKAGERAAALTRQLLAFSRKEIVVPVALDLNALILEMEKLLRRVIGEHLVVRTRLAPSLGWIRADPGQIEQILMNLAVNARDAMKTGGRLAIETQAVVKPDDDEAADARRVRLVVEDNGCGMSPEVQARIFEPFFTTKGVGKGTGLGLATVYGIVQQCKGRIKVSSEPGRGTRFTIDFPRIDAPAGNADAAIDRYLAQRGTETILLAEDEDSVRAFAREVLESAGYTVITACDGEDALNKVRAHHGLIQLLFTDAVMPRLGGRGLSERLRSERPTLKVLFTSGYDDDAVMQHGVLAGKAAFLQKPYAAIRLLQKIREVLDTDSSFPATPIAGAGGDSL